MLPNLSSLPIIGVPVAPPPPGNVPPPQGLLDMIPREILTFILGSVNGMECNQIDQLCVVSQEFANVCREPVFWKWQSELRGFSVPGQHLEQSDDGSYVPKQGFTWKQHYVWWCQYSLHPIPPAWQEILDLAVPATGNMLAQVMQRAQTGEVYWWIYDDDHVAKLLTLVYAASLPVSDMFSSARVIRDKLREKLADTVARIDATNANSLVEMRRDLEASRSQDGMGTYISDFLSHINQLRQPLDFAAAMQQANTLEEWRVFNSRYDLAWHLNYGDGL